MKVIFAGTPEFAATALHAIVQAGHDVVLVLTQPDRPAGRGQRLTPSAVSDAASALHLRTLKPTHLKDPATQQLLHECAADVMVVAAYGLLLPQAVLDVPRWGCLNIHGSLLPRWRGAAPVQRAIEAGDTVTGIDIMQMEIGLDTGPVLLEKTLPIADDDTAASLFAKLTALGATAIVEALATLPMLTPRPQSADGITYAHKLTKAEARIDWQQPASVIARRVRAFDPFPGCELMLNQTDKLKVWSAFPDKNTPNSAPGKVIGISNASLIVACGEGALAIHTVQRAGGKRQPIAEYLRSYPIPEGATLL